MTARATAPAALLAARCSAGCWRVEVHRPGPVVVATRAAPSVVVGSPGLLRPRRRPASASAVGVGLPAERRRRRPSSRVGRT